MKSGVDLLVSKAPNKGAVGLALSFFDTSLAIINCHLASDSKGRSRLKKRNEQVSRGMHIYLHGSPYAGNNQKAAGRAIKLLLIVRHASVFVV